MASRLVCASWKDSGLPNVFGARFEVVKFVCFSLHASITGLSQTGVLKQPWEPEMVSKEGQWLLEFPEMPSTPKKARLLIIGTLRNFEAPIHPELTRPSLRDTFRDPKGTSLLD